MEILIDILLFKFAWRSKIRRFVVAGILIVLAIIGFFVRSYNREQRPYSLTLKKSKLTINELNNFYSSINHFPDSLEEMISNNPLKRDLVYDGWKREFIYIKKNDSTFILVSSGPDGIINSDDDLVFKDK